MCPRSESSNFDSVADRYEESRGGAGRGEVFADALAPWLPSSGIVLDAGCGTAVVSAAVRARGFRVVPLDLSAEMLARAAARFPGGAIRGDATFMPFADATFGAVYFAWVLHHIGDAAAALSESRRVLRAGGRMIAISGVPDAGDDEMNRLFRRLDDLRPGYINPSDELRRTGEAAGFTCIATVPAPLQFEMAPAALVQRINDRLYAPLFDLDDAKWQAHVEPVIAGLLALDEPDRPRLHRYVHDVLVFAAP